MRRVEKVEFDGFERDDEKRQRVLNEREIDFLEAAQALLLPHLEEPSDKQGEARTLAVCLLNTKIVAVVYTERGDICRIVTARAARRYEREEYREVFGG